MSSVYADVIVDITNEKLDRTFQYKVPPELTGEIGPGTAVQIPFGNGNRTITGCFPSETSRNIRRTG